jgi:ABC-2 type transport system ATP-binding protein
MLVMPATGPYRNDRRDLTRLLEAPAIAGADHGGSLMVALVQADRLRKTFGPITAVDEISLEVSKGEVLGFLGPNGAGKSTTMKMLTGFLEPDAGVARIAGLNITEKPKEAKALVGYLPEGAPLYGDMTTKAFLDFIGEVRGFTGVVRNDKVATAIAKTGLESVANQSIDTLSKGFKRRVGIAQAILHNPPVLVLDEPTDGLDPNQKHQVRQLIAEMAKEKAIIVSTHILEEVEAVCSRAIIIDRGRIVADGTAEDLQKRLPQHNAVLVRVAETAVADATKIISSVPGISKIEAMSSEGGHTRLRANVKDHKPALAAVAEALRAGSVVVDELTVERGRLDDVFRQITTLDKGLRHG